MKGRKTFASPMLLHDALNSACKASSLRGMGLLILVGILLAGTSPSMERIDFDASVAQARAAKLRRSLPVVVLSRDTHAHPMGPSIASLVAQGKLPAYVPADFGYINYCAWNQAQEALTRLVPNTQHLVVTGSNHNIQIDHPQAVTDAIHEVFDSACKS